jgi:hypothetical protein
VGLPRKASLYMVPVTHRPYIPSGKFLIRRRSITICLASTHRGRRPSTSSQWRDGSMSEMLASPFGAKPPPGPPLYALPAPWLFERPIMFLLLVEDDLSSRPCRGTAQICTPAGRSGQVTDC